MWVTLYPRATLGLKSASESVTWPDQGADVCSPHMGFLILIDLQTGTRVTVFQCKIRFDYLIV
jgi:hypothetical protein